MIDEVLGHLQDLRSTWNEAIKQAAVAKGAQAKAADAGGTGQLYKV
jgi:flagellin-specific chaperone FliS